jgi:hypothetical protein
MVSCGGRSFARDASGFHTPKTAALAGAALFMPQSNHLPQTIVWLAFYSFK